MAFTGTFVTAQQWRSAAWSHFNHAVRFYREALRVCPGPAREWAKREARRSLTVHARMLGYAEHGQ
jgi:hypothetical protein